LTLFSHAKIVSAGGRAVPPLRLATTNSPSWYWTIIIDYRGAVSSQGCPPLMTLAKINRQSAMFAK
jgi:hypothetical protein